MAHAPALMLPLGTQPTVLFHSKCVDMTMDEKTSLVRITAHAGDDTSASCAVDGIMASADILLKRGKQFAVVWDLRESPVPDFASTARLAAWGVSHKRDLEALTSKMGVVVPGGPVSSVAAGMLAMFSAVPTKVGVDLGEVEDFV